MLLRIPGGWWFLGLAMTLATAANLPAQQPTADELAVQLLDAGRRAYNEKNLPFAADKFRQFLKDYGGHKDVQHARLGLGLALLESPTPDYQQAIDQLNLLQSDTYAICVRAQSQPECVRIAYESGERHLPSSGLGGHVPDCSSSAIEDNHAVRILQSIREVGVID